MSVGGIDGQSAMGFNARSDGHGGCIPSTRPLRMGNSFLNFRVVGKFLRTQLPDINRIVRLAQLLVLIAQQHVSQGELRLGGHCFLLIQETGQLLNHLGAFVQLAGQPDKAVRPRKKRASQFCRGQCQAPC